jgi:hypothetical protein
MMERMNNADFHKFLTEFSDAVAKGKYKKMPYDKYRELRKIKDSTVDISVNTYTNHREEKVSRIIVSPHGPVEYEFDMHDGSFGNFCYDYLKKKEEPKVHPNEKKQYDIYGNVIEDYYNYQAKCDKIDNTAKEAFLDYCTAKATGDSITTINTSWVSNAVDATKAGASWYDSISTSDSTHATTATIAMPSYVETKTLVDVLQEDVEDLKKLVEGNNCEIATKANLSDVNRDINALGDLITEINTRIDEYEYDVRERIEEARTAAIEESWFTRAELEQMMDERFKILEDKYLDYRNGTQGISSEPIKPKSNYNIEIKADYMPASDDRKEKENMDTNKMFAGFDFGPVDERIKMSVYGMAIRNADGRYVSYDVKTRNIVDVEVFNFENHNLIFKMPVAVSAIAVGDTIIHMKKPMFVTGVENGITAIDIFNGEVKTIMPAVNMFNFNYITKVVSMFNFIDNNAPTADNPFGNILPFMLMGNENMDTKDMFMMMAIANGNNMNTVFQNPMMMYIMLGNSIEMKEMLPFMMMSGMFNQTPVNNNHNCHCHNNSQN